MTGERSSPSENDKSAGELLLALDVPPPGALDVPPGDLSSFLLLFSLFLREVIVGAEIDLLKSIGATGFITCSGLRVGNWGYRTAISGRINSIDQSNKTYDRARAEE